MMNGKAKASAILLQKAEELLKRKPLMGDAPYSEADALELLNELEVCLSELELKIEHLEERLATDIPEPKVSDVALEESQKLYADLVSISVAR